MAKVKSKTRSASTAPTKSKAKPRAKTKKAAGKDLIMVDEKAGLIFENEETLFGYFQPAVHQLEEEYQSLRSVDDFGDEEQIERELFIETCLDDPDEIWLDQETIPDYPQQIFIKEIVEGDTTFKYVVVAYVSSDDDLPTFVYIHFPTRDSRLWQNYQRGELIFDKNYEKAAIGGVEGDALLEGDPLAIGLYQSMIKVRSEKDIPPEKFKDFADLREETIEFADEIWRKNDLEGNILVSFIKEFPDHEFKDLTYIAVTQEEDNSTVHSLLFSFPTTDSALVDRYRQGDNLQAEEITHESSH